jgi:hypothetical protein
MRRLFGLATTIAIVASLFMSTQPAQAVADGTVNCGTSGTFTIVSNIVTTNTNCRGSLTIPEGVTEIANGAFNISPDRSSFITSIVFPNSLTIIKESAFRAASSLTSINFGTGLQSIVHWNFADSTALTEVTIPSTVTSLGVGVFYLASQLETVTFLGNAPSTSSFTFGSVKAGAVANISSGATGFGAVGSTWSNLIVSAALAAPAFTLSSSSETRTVNTAATGFTINSTGGTIASFAISPSSPAGMSFNTTTGAFTGTPTSAASATAYTITATNASGSATRTFTLTVSAAAVVDNSAQQAAEAAAKRETDKRAARAELVESLKNSQKVRFGLFDQAEILGITPANVDNLYIEIFALPQESRVDISPVLKIARKYEVVGIVASERVISIHSNTMIEIDLIPEDSKHKAALTNAVKKQPFINRSSYTTIKELIDAEMTTIQARKDRYTAILARITSRQNG